MKMSKIKGILLDAINNNISEILIEFKGKYCRNELCNIIGCPSVEALKLDNINLLYVDSCGLLKPQEKYIKLKNYPAVLPGKAVVIGFSEKRQVDMNYKMDINLFRSETLFLTRKEAKFVAHTFDALNAKWPEPNVIYTKLSSFFE